MIRRLVLAALLAFAPGLASAQIAFIAPTVPTADISDKIANTQWVNNFFATGLPLANDKIFIGSAGGVATQQTMSGDCTLAPTGVITCTQAAGNFNVIGSLTVGGVIIDGNGALMTNIAAPVTPAAGTTRVYVDSSTKVLTFKNDAGAVGNAVVPSTAVANQYMTGISAAGVITRAQPSFADLTGSATCAQEPARTGDVTAPAGSCANTAVKVNGVAFAASPSTDTTPVVTAANNSVWTALPNCSVLAYTTATHLFSCGTGGQYVSVLQNNATATITVTIASPGVVTWTASNLGLGNVVYFTTTGALPTGLTASTPYFVIPVNANSFQLATTPANAIAGTAINTSGSQSGTHTGFNAYPLTAGSGSNVGFLNLSAGNWDVSCNVTFNGAASTTVSYAEVSINTASNSIDAASVNTTYMANVAFFGSVLGSGFGVVSAMKRIAGPVPVYCVAQMNFGTSTAFAFGTIRATQ